LASLVAVVIGLILFALVPVGLDLILHGRRPRPIRRTWSGPGRFSEGWGRLDPGIRALPAFAFAFSASSSGLRSSRRSRPPSNDPHTSQRGTFLFLRDDLAPCSRSPVTGDPEGTVARVLACCPSAHTPRCPRG